MLPFGLNRCISVKTIRTDNKIIIGRLDYFHCKLLYESFHHSCDRQGKSQGRTHQSKMQKTMKGMKENNNEIGACKGGGINGPRDSQHFQPFIRQATNERCLS